jgi:hypothetical protein
MMTGVILAMGAGSALAADEGAIKGKVTFEGAVPKAKSVPDLADPACKKMHPKGLETPTVKVKDGALADVFVQIKSGLPKDKKWDPPTEPVVLDQKGCMYEPHVFGIMAGQPLKVRNSDATNHNIHGLARVNQEFNFSQAQKGMEKIVELKKPEKFLIKCDVHQWMNAHAFVMSHPFFATSDADGNFEIKNVPAGTYDVELWHEALGSKTIKGVKVEAGKPSTLDEKEIVFTPKKPGAAGTKKPASK